MVRRFWRPTERSLGPAPGTVAAVGVLEVSPDSDCNFAAPSPPRPGMPKQPPSHTTWMLKIAVGIKTQWETQQPSLAGTVVSGWDSTREIGEPGDTWSWEKSWAVTDCDPDTWSWEKSWAVTDHEPDSLRTGQRIELCEKLGAC